MTRTAPETDAVYRRAIAAAVLCNVLEFFDFVTYAFFAVQIGAAFFPAADPHTSLLYSVAVFGVGFLARPVGSLVIGAYADRKGRRPALLITAVMMIVGTLGLAVMPTYAAIGLAAPILVTLCRLLQGFALGGEIGPAASFLMEISPPRHRALAVSLQIASQGAASVLAGSLGLLLALLLSPTEMADWGWRLPFAVGALLVPIAFILRRTMPETMPARVPTTLVQPRWIDRRLILGIGVIAGGTVSTYVCNYMATYSTTVLHLPQSSGLLATVCSGLATVGGALAGGQLADRVGRWPLMFWPRLAVALLSVPAFHLLLSQPTVPRLLAVSTLLAFLTAANGSGALTTICELFPPERRATALALTYSIGVALFGGTAQFAVTWLTGATGDALAPAWYIAATSIVAIAATVLLPETRFGALTRANKR